MPTSLFITGDSDSCSEPNKATSKTRMGLREDCGVGSGSTHRTHRRREGTAGRRQAGQLRLEVRREQEASG